MTSKRGHKQRTAGGTPPGMGMRPELALLFEETVRLYLRLKADATTLYKQGELSGPRRTILVAIARSGPRTVAQVARERFEARQRIQPLVNALLAEGLLESRVNPAHKRAPLVALTPRGEAMVRAITERESGLRARLKLRVPSADLARAAQTLRAVREALDAPVTRAMVR